MAAKSAHYHLPAPARQERAPLLVHPTGDGGQVFRVIGQINDAHGVVFSLSCFGPVEKSTSGQKKLELDESLSRVFDPCRGSISAPVLFGPLL